MIRANLITFVNTFSYYRLLDSGLPLERIDVVFVDGQIQVNLHNIFHRKKINRASFDFSSLADDCFEYVQRNNLKIALIGAKPNELKKTVKNLKRKYSHMQIVYSRDGYFQSKKDMQELCCILKEKKPDVIVVGMGTPEQEECALYLIEKGLLCQIITCGGFLTQTAKKTDYYRPLIKRFSLRWLQRAFEFKHVRKRLFVDYPKNIARYCIDHIKMLLKRKG